MNTPTTTPDHLREDEVIHRRLTRYAQNETQTIQLPKRRHEISYCDALVRERANSYRHCGAVAIYRAVAPFTNFHHAGIYLCPSHKNATSITVPI